MSSKNISDEVAAAFAENDFKSWSDIADFAHKKLAGHYNYSGNNPELYKQFLASILLNECDPVRRMTMQNYRDLVIGCFYLDDVAHPFPETSGLVLSIGAIQSLVKPLDTAEALNKIYANFSILSEHSVTCSHGKKAADEMYQGITQLKKIVPTTTRDSLFTIFSMEAQPVAPHAREKVDELCALAFSTGGVPKTMNDGTACTVN